MRNDVNDLLLVGRIARAHGNRGQVVVNLETDFAEERFKTGGTLLVGESAEPRQILDVRFHQGRPVLTLDGVATMNDAEALAGAELRIPESQRMPLPKGTFYRHDLVGCDVRDVADSLIGRVTGVEGPMERSNLVVQGARGEVLIPLAGDICVTVDPAEQRIIVNLPEGLLELNERSSFTKAPRP
jgi:16S rRNA processing protein RimM